MPNRVIKDQNYRFGFNGKEADREGQWGSTEHYDYGFRIYDPKIARFLSVDPLTASYSMLTPYQFAHNSPIAAIDLDGLEAEGTNEEIDETFSGGNLPEVVLTEKSTESNYDQTPSRYGYNGNWEQYQTQYGLENWSYNNYSSYYNQELGAAFDSYVSDQDRQERERIAIERMQWWFGEAFPAITTVIGASGGVGNGVNAGIGLRISNFNFTSPKARLYLDGVVIKASQSQPAWEKSFTGVHNIKTGQTFIAKNWSTNAGLPRGFLPRSQAHKVFADKLSREGGGNVGDYVGFSFKSTGSNRGIINSYYSRSLNFRLHGNSFEGSLFEKQIIRGLKNRYQLNDIKVKLDPR